MAEESKYDFLKSYSPSELGEFRKTLLLGMDEAEVDDLLSKHVPSYKTGDEPPKAEVRQKVKKTSAAKEAIDQEVNTAVTMKSVLQSYLPKAGNVIAPQLILTSRLLEPAKTAKFIKYFPEWAKENIFSKKAIAKKLFGHNSFEEWAAANETARIKYNAASEKKKAGEPLTDEDQLALQLGRIDLGEEWKERKTHKFIAEKISKKAIISGEEQEMLQSYEKIKSVGGAAWNALKESLPGTLIRSASIESKDEFKNRMLGEGGIPLPLKFDKEEKKPPLFVGESPGLQKAVHGVVTGLADIPVMMAAAKTGIGAGATMAAMSGAHGVVARSTDVAVPNLRDVSSQDEFNQWANSWIGMAPEVAAAYAGGKAFEITGKFLSAKSSAHIEAVYNSRIAKAQAMKIPVGVGREATVAEAFLAAERARKFETYLAPAYAGTRIAAGTGTMAAGSAATGDPLALEDVAAMAVSFAVLDGVMYAGRRGFEKALWKYEVKRTEEFLKKSRGAIEEVKVELAKKESKEDRELAKAKKRYGISEESSALDSFSEALSIVGDAPNARIIAAQKKGIPQANIEVASALAEMAEHSPSQKRAFAYSRASKEILNTVEDLSTLGKSELLSVKWVGRHIGEVVHEYMSTGKIGALEAARAEGRVSKEYVRDKITTLGLSEKAVTEMLSSAEGKAEIERMALGKRIRSIISDETSAPTVKTKSFDYWEAPDGDLPYRARFRKYEGDAEINSHIIVNKEAEGYSVRMSTIGGRQQKSGRTTVKRVSSLGKAMEEAEKMSRQKKKEGFLPEKPALEGMTQKEVAPQEKIIPAKKIPIEAIEKVVAPDVKEVAEYWKLTDSEVAKIKTGHVDGAVNEMYSRLAKTEGADVYQISTKDGKRLLRGSKEAMDGIFDIYMAEYKGEVVLSKVKLNALEAYRYFDDNTLDTETAIKSRLRGVVERAGRNIDSAEVLAAGKRLGGDAEYEMAKRKVSPDAIKYGKNIEKLADEYHDAFKSGKKSAEVSAAGRLLSAWKNWFDVEGDNYSIIEFENFRRTVAKSGSKGLYPEPVNAGSEMLIEPPPKTMAERVELVETRKQVAEVVKRKTQAIQETIADSLDVPMSSIPWDSLSAGQRTELSNLFERSHKVRLSQVPRMSDTQVSELLGDTASRPDISPTAKLKLTEEIIRIRKNNTEYGEHAETLKLAKEVMDMAGGEIDQLLVTMRGDKELTRAKYENAVAQVAASIGKRWFTRWGEAVAKESGAGADLVRVLRNGVRDHELMAGQFAGDIDKITSGMSKAESYLLAKGLEYGPEKFIKEFLPSRTNGEFVKVVVNDRVMDVSVKQIDVNRVRDSIVQADAFLKKVFMEFRKVGLNIEGEVDHYFPRVLKEAVYTNSKYREVVHEQIMKDMLAKKTDIPGTQADIVDALSSAVIKGDALHVLDAKKFNKLRHFANRHLDSTRMNRAERKLGYQYKRVCSELPEFMYETDGRTVLLKYAEDVGARIGEAINWGPKDSVLNDKIMNIVKEVAHLPEATDIVGRAVRLSNSMTWRTAMDSETSKIVRTLLHAQVVLRMPFSAISQTSQIFAGIPVGNLESFIKGVKWRASGKSRYLDKVVSPTGTELGNILVTPEEFFIRCGSGLSMIRNEVLKYSIGASQFTDKFLQYSGFKYLDSQARYQAVVTGFFFSEYLVDSLSRMALKVTSLSPKEFVDYMSVSKKGRYVLEKMRAFDLDPIQILQRGKNQFGKYYLTGNEKLESARKFEVETNYRARPIDLPEEWTQSAWGKIASQFRTYDFSKTIEINKHILAQAREGNLTPLLQLAGIGAVSGTMNRELRNVLRWGVPGDPFTEDAKELAEAIRTGRSVASKVSSYVYESIGNAGYLGLYGSLLDAIGIAANIAGVETPKSGGKFDLSVQGAALSTIAKTGEAIQQSAKRKHGKWAPLAANAVENVALLGYLFGPVAGPAVSLALGARSKFVAKQIMEIGKGESEVGRYVDKGMSRYRAKQLIKRREERRKRRKR